MYKDDNQDNIIEINDDIQKESDKQELHDTKEHQTIVPVITYVREEKSEKPSFLANMINTSTEDSYNRIIEREQEDVFRWNYKEHNKKHKKGNLTSNSGTKTKSSLGLKIFAAVMSVFFLFTAVSTTLLFMQNNNLQTLNKNNNPQISNVNAVSANSNADGIIEVPDTNSDDSVILTTPQVIQKVKPSVVCIEVKVTSSYFGRQYEESGVGTGFILTEDGYIATNYHVIENSTNIKVTLGTGDSYDAALIGGDSVSDLAVLKINAKNLPVAELGNSDALVEGEDVVAIGTPAGVEFAGTTTKGIVSAINRNIEIQSEKGYTTKTMTVLQTDASINPGNSGGPLVNNKGQVIGINTMKLSSNDYEGMGFAIPINGAIPIINDLIENKGITTSHDDSFVTMAAATKIGISGTEVTAEEAAEKNIPEGIKIASIEAGGPCDGVGIHESDIIIAYNGKTVRTFDDVKELKSSNKVGDEVTLTIYRNGDTYDFKIILQAAD